MRVFRCSPALRSTSASLAAAAATTAVLLCCGSCQSTHRPATPENPQPVEHRPVAAAPRATDHGTFPPADEAPPPLAPPLSLHGPFAQAAPAPRSLLDAPPTTGPFDQPVLPEPPPHVAVAPTAPATQPVVPDTPANILAGPAPEKEKIAICDTIAQLRDPKPEPALIDGLVLALQDGGAVSVHARAAILKVGSAAVPALITAAKLSEGGQYDAVADTLSALGAHAKEFVPRLVEESRSDQIPVRVNAIKVLGAIGPAGGTEASAAVIAALHDEAGAVGTAALLALRHVAPELDASVAAQVADLCSSAFYGSHRSGAARALGAVDPKLLKPDRLGVVPALTKALTDVSSGVRLEAVRSLGRLGKPGATAVPQLVALIAAPAPPSSDPNDAAARASAADPTVGIVKRRRNDAR